MPSMYDNMLTSLAPHMKLLSDIGGSQSTGATSDFAKADLNYDEVLKFYKTILGGDRDNILKNLDASATTAAYDEQARQNYEFAPRGGRRAATAANLEFSKMGELNKLLQFIRGQAPGQIANIAQAISGQGTSKLNAAINSILGVTNLRTGIETANEEMKQREADRKAQLIGSIFGAAGTVAGAYLGCNTLDTWILTPNRNHVQLKELRVGDKVCTLKDEKLEEAKIIRKDILEEQEIYELVCNDSCLKGTISHTIAGMNDAEYTFQDLAEIIITIPIYKNEELAITTMKSLKRKRAKEDVAILKLNNENKNFNYITNGFISIDADCAG